MKQRKFLHKIYRYALLGAFVPLFLSGCNAAPGVQDDSSEEADTSVPAEAAACLTEAVLTSAETALEISGSVEVADDDAAEAVVFVDSGDSGQNPSYTWAAPNVSTLEPGVSETYVGTNVITGYRDVCSKADYDALTAALIRSHYADALCRLSNMQALPCVGSLIITGSFQVSDNDYAIADIDGDGREELLVCFTTTYTAGEAMFAYDYHPDTDTLTLEFTMCPELTYYDNGAIIEESIHNQSPSEFWPYMLYLYDAPTDSYTQIASIDAWDKQYADSRSCYTHDTWHSFPDELDADGDGILYSIEETDNDDYACFFSLLQDESAYLAWYDSYMHGAQEISPAYLPVTSKNYNVYTQEYLALLRTAKEAVDPPLGTDLGLMWLTNECSCSEFLEILTTQYGVTIYQTPDDDVSAWDDGTYACCDGQETFHFWLSGNPSVTYTGRQIGDITFFDLYPGMEEEAARRKLASFGFYYLYGDADTGYFYITGMCGGNYAVDYKTQDGRLTEITVSEYNGYAG